MPLLHIRKQIDYKSTEKRGKWSLNRNNRKNEKIKKKQLTRRMKGAIIAKSLVRQSISTKKTKKSLKKVLDICCRIWYSIKAVSQRQAQNRKV